MKEYNLTFWEKQIVWNKRLVVVKTDMNPLELSIDDLEDSEVDIKWIDVIVTMQDGVEEIMEIEIVDNNGHPIQEEE